MSQAICAEKVDIEKVFRAAARQLASDILISAGCPVIFRIKGKLVNTAMEPLDPMQVRELVYSVLQSDQIARLEQEKELDFSLSFGIQRFRGNAFWQRGSVGAAFRRIPDEIPALDSLNLPPVLGDLAMLSQGLILLVGPTGHGKSTTMAAMLDRINQKERRHIITIEEPIEYLYRNRLSIIEQREVGGGHALVQDGAQACAAPGPGRDPDRRDA